MKGTKKASYMLEGKETMERKCYKCGSTNIARVVPASLATVPEIKKEILEGRAVMNCCCAGTGTKELYRCKDCNFEWDYFYELGMKQQEESEEHSKDEKKADKKKWWKF